MTAPLGYESPHTAVLICHVGAEADQSRRLPYEKQF